MFHEADGELTALSKDDDEAVIRLLLSGLRGGVRKLEPDVEANLLNCATMALFHGRRMDLATQDAFDALAAICLVLGSRRSTFFENVFLNRMINNPNLSPREKLNRVVEIVIGTIPRPAKLTSNDNPERSAV